MYDSLFELEPRAPLLFFIAEIIGRFLRFGLITKLYLAVLTEWHLLVASIRREKEANIGAQDTHGIIPTYGANKRQSGHPRPLDHNNPGSFMEAPFTCIRIFSGICSSFPHFHLCEFLLDAEEICVIGRRGTLNRGQILVWNLVTTCKKDLSGT